MKYLVAGLLIAIMSIPSKAEARAYGYTHQYARHLVARHWRHLNRRYSHHIKRRNYPKTHFAATTTRETLPGPCRTAASMGGPCGCWTAWNLLGKLDHVWKGVNLWLAWDWAEHFRRVDPAPGTAAVWKNHSHVAPVTAVNRDGTVTVRDYWATHRVSVAQVIFVDPSPRRRGYRVAGAWPL